MLVEPHPEYFLRLQQNYSSSKRIFFENVAVSDIQGSLDLFHVKDVSVDKYWSTGIASFDKQHLIRHGIIEDNISVTKVPPVTLSSIVHKYYLYDVDLLVIDVEGHELNVFRSGEFKIFQPKLIIFENHHLSEETIDGILDIVGPGNPPLLQGS